MAVAGEIIHREVEVDETGGVTVMTQVIMVAVREESEDEVPAPRPARKPCSAPNPRPASKPGPTPNPRPAPKPLHFAPVIRQPYRDRRDTRRTADAVPARSAPKPCPAPKPRDVAPVIRQPEYIGYRERRGTRRPADAVSARSAPKPFDVAPVIRQTEHMIAFRDRRDSRRTAGNITLSIITFVLSLGYGALVVLSIKMYDSCPDRRMALYTVIQGSFAMFNCGMCALWLMQRCVSYKRILAIWTVIFLFNLIWSLVGIIWIVASPCHGSRLKWYAIASAIPLSLLFPCCGYAVSRKRTARMRDIGDEWWSSAHDITEA